jgi:hypothetical protein
MAENWIYGAYLNVVSTWARGVAPPEIRRLLAAERLQVHAAKGLRRKVHRRAPVSVAARPVRSRGSAEAPSVITMAGFTPPCDEP